MKLIVFDCDGTLVDSQHVIVAAMEDAFCSVALEPPPRLDILNVVGLSLITAVARLLPHNADPALAERLSEAYKESFAARRQRPDHAEPLYPGVRETIERLAARDDVLLGIATGKSIRGVAAVLERERMAAYFATVQTADTHPSKPHPSMLLHAMGETGAEPGDTIMIGDTTYDVEMARAAGAEPIGVGWGYHPESALRHAGAPHVVTTSLELDSMLDRLIAGSKVRQS